MPRPPLISPSPASCSSTLPNITLSPKSPHIITPIVRQYSSKRRSNITTTDADPDCRNETPKKRRLYCVHPASLIDRFSPRFSLLPPTDTCGTSLTTPEPDNTSGTPTPRISLLPPTGTCGTSLTTPEPDNTSGTPTPDASQITLKFTGGRLWQRLTTSESHNVTTTCSTPTPENSQPTPKSTCGTSLTTSELDITPSSGMQDAAERRRRPTAEQKLRDKLRKVRRKCNLLQVQLRRAKKFRPPSAEDVAQLAAKFLSPVVSQLFFAQLKSSSKAKNQWRWTVEMKDFALCLFFHSPRSYRFLRKILRLPSLSTLSRFKSLIPLNTGVHSHVIDYLRDEVPKWPVEKRLCTLVFDEVSIKRNLSYDAQQDKLVGLVDGGFSRKDVVADQALVVMIKGCVINWKQLLGHWFTTGREGAGTIESALYQCLHQLRSVGLIVKMVVCDQGAKNRSVITRAGVSHEKPFFLYQEEKVFFMWDSPHLIKSMRNNLIKYDFKWKQGIAKWGYIKMAVKNDDPLRFRLLPKVTLRHIDFRNGLKKMKVKLAAQVLSRSMSTALLVLQLKGILPADSVHTAEFVQDMNDLFDCFNSSKRLDKISYKFAFSSSSRHRPFLEGILGHLTEGKFLQCSRQPDCLRGWILNIRSLLMFSEHLLSNYGVGEIRTRLLNQDCLENTFSIVRQQHGCSDHPTAKQFESGLRSLSLSSMSKLPSSTNCEEELEQALLHINANLNRNSIVTKEQSEQEEFAEIDLDSASLSSVEENAFFYCAGFITRQFLRVHQCETCKAALILRNDNRVLAQDYQLFAYFKAFSDAVGEEFGSLCLPTDHAFNVIKELEGIFFNRFHVASHRTGILRIVTDSFKFKQIFMNLCCQESEIQFQNMYARYRIGWECKSLNRKLADPVAEKRITVKKLFKVKKTP